MFFVVCFGITRFLADRLAVKIGTPAPSLMTNSLTTILSLVCVTLYLITLHPSSYPSTSHLTPCNPAALTTPQSTVSSFCEVFWCLNLCRLAPGDQCCLLWAPMCQDLSTQTSSQRLNQECHIEWTTSGCACFCIYLHRVSVTYLFISDIAVSIHCPC